MPPRNRVGTLVGTAWVGTTFGRNGFGWKRSGRLWQILRQIRGIRLLAYLIGQITADTSGID